jgi:protein-S-isoprenylcysteine O-methyltransferase Ste14
MRSKVLVRMLIFLLILAGVWYDASGRIDLVMPWVFLGVYLVVGGIVPALIVPLDEELAEERTQIKEGVKGWDKPIVAIGSLYVPLGIVILAGLDARFGWSSPLPLGLQIAALVIGGLGYPLSVWASASNPFHGRFVRIQTERGHTVQTGGPYRYVRHPGYAGIIVFLPTSAVALDSLWTLVASGVVAVLMVIRTALEDRVLLEELPGYEDYASRVRFRLVPGIW